MVATKDKPCGNPMCGVSTGIHGGLTFGSGELDEYGFWQVPCCACARAHEKSQPQDGNCWPFTNEQLWGTAQTMKGMTDADE